MMRKKNFELEKLARRSWNTLQSLIPRVLRLVFFWQSEPRVQRYGVPPEIIPESLSITSPLRILDNVNAVVSLDGLDQAEAAIQPAQGILPDKRDIGSPAAQITTRQDKIDIESEGHLADLSKYPENAVTYLETAAQFANAERWIDALTSLTEAVAYFPEDDRLYLARAQIMRRSGDTEGALLVLTDMRQTFPAIPGGYSEAAEIFRQSGRPTEAEDILRSGVENVPDDPWLWWTFGFVAQLQHAHVTALNRFHAGRCRCPDLYQLWGGEIDTLRTLGRLDEAEAVVQQARQRFPDEPGIGRLAAQIATNRGETDVALARWSTFRHSRPGDAQAYLEPAALLANAERWADALALLAQGAARCPEDDKFYLVRAQILRRSGDTEGALSVLANMRQKFPTAQGGYSEAADLLRHCGRLSEAEDILRMGVENVPGEPWLWWAFGLVAQLQQLHATAWDRFREGRHRCPELYQLWGGEIDSLLFLDRLDEAEAVVTEAQNRFPTAQPLWRFAAQIAERRGDIDGLIDRWAEFRDHDSDNVLSYIEPARILANKARLDEAITLLNAGLERLPSDDELYRTKADILQRSGDTDGALGVLAELRRQTDSETSYIEAGHLLLQQDNEEGAKNLIDLLLQREQLNFELASVCLELAVKSGSTQNVRDAWQALADFSPNSDLEQRNLANIVWKIFEREDLNPVWVNVTRYLLSQIASGKIELYRAILVGLTDYPENPAGKRLKIVLIHDLFDDSHTWLLKWVTGYQLDDEKTFSVIEFLLSLPHPSCLFAHCGWTINTRRENLSKDVIERHAVLDRFVKMKVLSNSKFFENSPQYIINLISVLSVVNNDLFAALLDALHMRNSIQDAVSAVGDQGKALAHIIQCWGTPRPAVHSRRRLKIAVCVSGQMRGFKRAHKTWDVLRFDKHDTEYFVHTWFDIGRRLPIHAFALHRCFTGNLLRVYRAMLESFEKEGREQEAYQRYETIISRFSAEGRVAVDELKNFYRTEHVVLQDDTAIDFSGWRSALKMHYKIEEAYKLARAVEHKFDLYIRIRPDLAIDDANAAEPDWYELYKCSCEGRQLFIDTGLGIPGAADTRWGGDNFAAGCQETYDVYARLYSRCAAGGRNVVGLADSPTDLQTHASIAAVTLGEAIDVRWAPVVGPDAWHAQDPAAIPTEEVLTALRIDIGRRKVDEWDNKLIAACEDDLASALPIASGF